MAGSRTCTLAPALLQPYRHFLLVLLCVLLVRDEEDQRATRTLCLRSCEASQPQGQVGTKFCPQSFGLASPPRRMGAFVKFLCPQRHLYWIHTKTQNRQAAVPGIGRLLVCFSCLSLTSYWLLSTPGCSRPLTQQDTSTKRPQPEPWGQNRPHCFLKMWSMNLYVIII